MSLATAMLIFDKYGPLLGPDELARVTGYATGTIENMIARGDFEIPTAKRGRRTAAPRAPETVNDGCVHRRAARAHHANAAQVVEGP